MLHSKMQVLSTCMHRSNVIFNPFPLSPQVSIWCLVQKCKELQPRLPPFLPSHPRLTWWGGWSHWWFQLQLFHSWMPARRMSASVARWTSPFKLKDTSMSGAKMSVPRPSFPLAILQVFQSGIRKTTSSCSCQILQAVRWLCHLNGSSLDGLGSTFSWLLESRILSQWTSRNRRSWNWSVEVCWMWTRSECRLHRVTGKLLWWLHPTLNEAWSWITDFQPSKLGRKVLSLLWWWCQWNSSMCQSRPWTKHPPPLLVDHTQMSWSGPNFPLTFPMHFQRAWNSGTWQAFCFETTLVLAWTTISGGLKVRLIALMEGTTTTLALPEIWLLVSCTWSCTPQHPTQAWLFSSHIPSALRLSRNLKRSQRTTNTFGISGTTNMSRWPFPCHQAMCMVLFGPSIPQMVSQPGIAWVLFVILGMAWWRDPSMQLVAPLSLPATPCGWSSNMRPRWSQSQPPCCSMWPMPTFKTSWIGPPPTPACKSESGKESEAEPDRQMLDSTESSDSSDSHVTSAFLLFVSAVWMTLIWVAVN